MWTRQGRLPGLYPTVPAGAAQSGDFYTYLSEAFDANLDLIAITQTTTSGGGPVIMTLPAPWSFAGPAPARFPTFTFNYAGFSGMPMVAQQAEIAWATALGPLNSLSVTATANSQNGATTLTMPDLSALSGFFAPPAASGTQVSWDASIFGGRAQQFPLPFTVNTPPNGPFSVNTPPNGLSAVVNNNGSYTQP